MKSLFLPFIQKQTYKNLFYIIATFILSNIYFIFFTTGFSLSFGLIFILVGIPLFFVFLYLVKVFGNMEKLIANSVIKANISNDTEAKPSGGFFNWLKDIIEDPKVWRRLLYFIIKYPMDILMFTLAITFLGMSVQLIISPFLYDLSWFSNSMFINWIYNFSNPYIIFILGFMLLIFSLHLINAIAEIYIKFTRSLLR